MSGFDPSSGRVIAALRDVILDNRQDADRLRRLPDPVAAAFARHNAYRVLLPRDLGGEGMDPVQYLRMIEQISYFDASAGWNLTIGSGSALSLGFLLPEIAAEILAMPDACIAGQFAPLGRAKKVDEGYRVTGRWGWVSGLHQANWLFGGCVVEDDDGPLTNADGAPVTRHVFVPKEACAILDTWHVGGLRGTGSADFSVEDRFVPEGYAFELFKSEIVHPAPIFRLPSTWFGIALSLVPSGTARAAVDALAALAVGKSSALSRSRLKDRPSAQYVMAKAQAIIESTQAHVFAVTAGLWFSVVENQPFDMASRAKVRRATVHAAEAAVEVVEMVYREAGAAAILESNPFERSLRDAHAALGHITIQKAMMEDAGRVAFGLDPTGPLF